MISITPQHPGQALHDAARQPRPIRNHHIHVQQSLIQGGAMPSEGRGVKPVEHPSQAKQNEEK